ncbi:thymidine kinase [Haloglycomyces albus]|uniref:thymidine kinase n=1 Tax=Haloglycomyces albus TaxID=526067 RepID=UPI00046D1D2E|nr:thymidine kinase [Haloglycomyces albus]
MSYELVAYLGVMDAGKSTLALQYHHSLGGNGVLYTCLDRSGSGMISSRIGLSHEAREVAPDLDIYDQLAELQPEYVVVDEVQFLNAPKQINHLADAVDGLKINVYAFGLKTDFLGRLFPASARLLELADRVEELPVPVRCWCGARGTHNARVRDGVMVFQGDVVEIGDMDSYTVLCRKHHRAGLA